MRSWSSSWTARAWYILTNDKKIRRRPAERDAVMRAGAAVFVLVGGHASSEQLAKNFINTLAKIEQFIETHAPPFIRRCIDRHRWSELLKGDPDEWSCETRELIVR